MYFLFFEIFAKVFYKKRMIKKEKSISIFIIINFKIDKAKEMK